MRHDDVDDLLEEFAAALFGEIGSRAMDVAHAQADAADDPIVAGHWRRIAEKVRARS